MRKEFRSFIEKHQLIGFGEKILLAVSGGVDSMVMLHLFKECGYSIAVAHCNFSLRGKESDDDERFVREICQKLKIEIFVKQFDTAEHAQNNNLSIQVAARDLRYKWFHELCSEHRFASVAIAHNRNDIAETMLINLCRGTGLKGLAGIKPKSNLIIRPLLFATREQIEEYAKIKEIEFRVDSSNTETKYARNRIRHNVIPELENINAGVVENLYSTSLFLSQAWTAIGEELIKLREETCKQIDNEIHYSIQALKKSPLRQIFLVEELVEYGFSPSQVVDIDNALFTQSGKVFYSHSYQLIRDRKSLILAPKKQEITANVEIDLDTKEIDSPISLRFDQKDIDSSFKIQDSTSIGVFDIEKIYFPIILRPWKEGDWFIPLGMMGRKKISDFLIDQKVPLHLKKKIYVIESNGDIIWVVGYRIDNRFRVTELTKKGFIAAISEH